MAVLNGQELDEFLSQPLNAELVTMRRSGRPHVAPVWFLWQDGQALVMADGSAVKVRNIRRNPAVALCVPTSDRPYAFVTIEGNATVGQDGLESMCHSTCTKYDGPVRGPEYARELLSEDRMTLITITPDRVITWRDGDDEEG